MLNTAEKTIFAFLGDTQCDRLNRDDEYSVWNGLLHRAESELHNTGSMTDEEQPLLVISGDLVNHTRDQAEWAAFLKAGGDFFARAKVITPTGNHDRSSAYDKRFDLPADGPAGLEKRFYSYDHGFVRFIVMDTNHLETSDPEKIAGIRKWLFARLSGKDVPPVKIALMHHPLFSLGSSLDDDIRAAVMQKNYLDVLDRCGVSLVLCGHQHVYCRSYVLDSTGSPSDSGIVQIMGVSGGKHHSPRRTDCMQYIRSGISVATVIETDGETIYIRTVSSDGEVLDEWSGSINHPKEGILNPSAAEADAENSAGGAVSKPAGIRVKGQGIKCSMLFTDNEIRSFDLKDICYSLYRRSCRSEKTLCGYELTGLLEKAGWDGSGTGIRLTTSDGFDITMRLGGLLEAWTFDEQGQKAYKVPSLLIREEKPGCAGCGKADSCEKEKTQWSLVFGQQHPEDRVTRKWVHGLQDIEIVDIDGLLGMYREENGETNGNDSVFYSKTD